MILNRGLSLFALFTLAACGVEVPQEEVGSYRHFEPVSISTDEYNKIKNVCDALKAKEAVLQQYVSNQIPFHFNYGEKTCAAESIEKINPVIVKMRNSGQDFEFYPTVAQPFGYTMVETSRSGLMADVCNNLAAKVSPIVGRNGGGVWFGYFHGNKECQSSPTQSCILIELGKKVKNDSYQIHTREWIKFNISGVKEGFFSERKTFSSIGCAPGLMIEKMAVAK